MLWKEKREEQQHCRGMTQRNCGPFFIVLLLVISLPMLSSADNPTERSSYITIDQLQEITSLMLESERRAKVAQTHVISRPKVQTEVDIYVKSVLGLSTDRNILTLAKLGGIYTNDIGLLFHAAHVNEPFFDRVPRKAGKVADVAKTITNGTIRNGEVFEWPGGSIYTDVMDGSQVYLLSHYCHIMEILYANRTRVSSSVFQFFHGNTEPSVLLHMGRQNSPILCGGSGVVFSDHGNGSQPLWLRISSKREAQDTGTMFTGNLNKGNYIANLTRSQLQTLQESKDRSIGISILGAFLGGLENFEQMVELNLGQYNNASFLILTVAAMLSSAAVAGVSLGPGFERNIILAVEAIVVYSFLAIISHFCVVFTRKYNFLVDVCFFTGGNFTFDDKMVYFQGIHLHTAVGERLQPPKLLIVTEAFAVIISVAVTGVLIYNFNQMRRRKKKKSTGTFTEMGNDEYFPEKSE